MATVFMGSMPKEAEVKKRQDMREYVISSTQCDAWSDNVISKIERVVRCQ